MSCCCGANDILLSPFDYFIRFISVDDLIIFKIALLNILFPSTNSTSFIYSSADKITVTPITSIVQHAEGPTWSQSEEALFFVDTFTATAYRWNFANGETTCQKIGK